MKVTFFTILLDGMPYLPHLIKMLLPVAHEWFFVEGACRPIRCTKHCAMPPPWSYDPETGLSTDGTREFLDDLAARDSRVKVIRKNGLWDGKKEMVNSFVGQVTGEFLWQLDVDEFYYPEAVEKTIRMMEADPSRTAARFYCHFFFGDAHTVAERSGVGNDDFHWNWLRCWRAQPGAFFKTHEPPDYVIQTRRFPIRRYLNLSKAKLLDRDETEAAGLIMYHYAYSATPQIRFKEDFYRMPGLYTTWKGLRAKLARGEYPRIEEEFPMLDHNLYRGRLLPFRDRHPLDAIEIA